MLTKITSLIAALLTLAVEAGAAASPCPIALNLSVVKGSYMAGEPIEIRLTANNRGSEPVSIAANYPTFEAGSDSGLNFTLADERKAVRRSEPKQVQSKILELVIPGRSVAPGQTWSVSVFLQRFMPDLLPGIHSIEYSAKLRCFGQNHLEAGTADGQGTLSVAILDSKEPELATAIAELASRLDTADFSAARSAEEAMLVANSPLVIPYLRPLLWGDKAGVVRALAKFPGNPDAENIVLGVLRDGRIDEAGLALSVIEEWKYLLNPSDFEGVLARGDSHLRWAALRYADSVGSRTLIPAVSAYVEDPDSQVAAEAKRVLDALSAKGR